MNRETLIQNIKERSPQINFILQNKIISTILLIFSSGFLYLCGYLFLWGFYLGGRENQSLLSFTINYVPLNKYSVLTVGAFYLLIIVQTLYFFLAVMREKLKESFLVLIISFFLINLSLSIFLFDGVNHFYFIKTLAFWILPVLLIIIFYYFYSFYKYPSYTTSYFILYLIFTLNTLISLGFFDIQSQLTYFSLLLIYVPSLLIVMFLINRRKIFENKNIKTIIGTASLFSSTPSIYMIFYNLTKQFFLSLVLNLLIVFIIYKIIIFIIRLENKAVLHNKNTHEQHMKFLSHPLTFISFMLSVISISLTYIPIVLIEGGKYIRSINENISHEKITYVYNKKEETIKGIVLTKENDTYYIATPEKELMIINVKDVKRTTIK